MILKPQLENGKVVWFLWKEYVPDERSICKEKRLTRCKKYYDLKTAIKESPNVNISMEYTNKTIF